MAQVAGDAAELVDPYDVDSIRRGLMHIVSDAAYREHLRQRGLDRAARFTWEEAALRTLEVYAAAIQVAASREAR